VINRLLDWVEKHYFESAATITLGTAILLILVLYAIVRGAHGQP